MVKRGFRRFGSAVVKATRQGLGRWAHGISTQFFRQGVICRQPFADSYECPIYIEAQGTFATGAGTNVGSFAFALNSPVLPFNNSGALGVLPNAVLANGSNNPNGLKNLLQNATTGTGLYVTGIVLATQVEVNFQPQTAGDNVKVAFGPVSGASNSYGSAEACAQGPQCYMSLCTSVMRNSIKRAWSPASLLGIPDSLYGVTQFGTMNFTNTVNPVPTWFLQVYYRTLDNAVLVNVLPVVVRVRYMVRWFERTDTQLLDS